VQIRFHHQELKKSVYASSRSRPRADFQKPAAKILIWANREKIRVDEFVQIQVSTRNAQLVVAVKVMTGRMQPRT